nr:MAG: hypothetical protein [Apis mellifera filamentous virus]
MALSVCTKREKRKVKHVSLKVAHVSTERTSPLALRYTYNRISTYRFFFRSTVFEDDPDFAQLYISPRVSSARVSSTPPRLFAVAPLCASPYRACFSYRSV